MIIPLGMSILGLVVNSPAMIVCGIVLAVLMFLGGEIMKIPLDEWSGRAAVVCLIALAIGGIAYYIIVRG